MDYIVMIIIGMIIGGAITYFTVKREMKPSGTFVIDVSDPMKDICTFELEESLDFIYSKKQILLNVKTYAELSSK